MLAYQSPPIGHPAINYCPGFPSSQHSEAGPSKAAEGRRTPGRGRDSVRSWLLSTIIYIFRLTKCEQTATLCYKGSLLDIEK
jgi:hypothetical protein